MFVSSRSWQVTWTRIHNPKWRGSKTELAGNTISLVMEVSNLFACLECFISEEADKRTYEGIRGSLSDLISQYGGIVHSLLVQDVDVIIALPSEYSVLKEAWQNNDVIPFVSPLWVVESFRSGTVYPFVIVFFLGYI